MSTLGLHQMTALDADPVELVSIAAQTGCGEVSVFVQPLAPGDDSMPLVNAENRAAFQQRLRETGVRVANIEAFMIVPGVDVESFRPALALGVELGARGATALVMDPDEARAAAALARLCDIAAEFDLRIAVEFLALAPVCNSLQAVSALLARVARPNLGIGLDILHLVRSGGTPAEVAALAPGQAFNAQLSDSADLSVTADYGREAAIERLAPGDGRFPLLEFLRALPAGTPLELEVPQPPGPPPLARARHAVAGARRLMQLAGLD